MQQFVFIFLTAFVAVTNCQDPDVGEIRVYVVQADKDYSLAECKANLDDFIHKAQQDFWSQSTPALVARYGIDISQVDSATLLTNEYHDISAEISVRAYPRRRPVVRGYVVVSTYEQDLADMSTQDKLNYLKTARQVVYDKVDKEFRRICK